MTIHSSRQTISNFPPIDGIILVVSEEIHDVAGTTVGMGLNGLDEVRDRASKGQAEN